VSERSGETGIAFLRGAEAEAFAGARVEAAGEGITGPLREVRHARALGEVLPEQAVGVLVGAALPPESEMSVAERAGVALVRGEYEKARRLLRERLQQIAAAQA
jgi:hypothetical protein